MKLVETGWAVVDERWRIQSDSKGYLIFKEKSFADKAAMPGTKEMVVEAQIFISEDLKDYLDKTSN